MTETRRPLDQNERDRRYYRLAMRIFVEFGAEIAIPVVFLAVLGRYLDARWGTKPWLLIIGFALAATISAITIAKRAKTYGKEYEEIGKN